MRKWLGIGVSLGGALILYGATLPWLTLYAGLQTYPGTIGLYGRLMLVTGLIPLALGIIGLWKMRVWLAWAGAIVGGMALVFDVWLIAGMNQIVHRPETLILVARPGSGLYVVFAGAAIVLAAEIANVLDNDLAVVQDTNVQT